MVEDETIYAMIFSIFEIIRREEGEIGEALR